MSPVASPILKELNEDDGKMYHYFNCPLMFVPPNTWRFAAIYKYHHDYPSAPMPAFKEVSVRYLQACRIYERKFAEYMKG